ncbi:replication initiation protein [Neisseria bergeri]|uniref:replication initiation protein n=1 Tax=Neisseria bergeri TaxID=1906581 RepID=UPI0027DF7DEF|nr:replication initiation protein [Neisseria bergeri]
MEIKMTSNHIDKQKTPQSLTHMGHSLSEMQYKYWYLLLQNIKTHFEQGGTYDERGFVAISVKHLEHCLGYVLSIKQLKKDLDTLRSASLILNYLEKDGRPIIHGMGYISEWKIDNGKILYKVSDIIFDELMSERGNRMFLLMDWMVFNSLPGKYCGVIYKLCKDYAGIGKTPSFTVQEFRYYLGLDDKEYKEYKEFKVLNANIIKPAIGHINNSENVDIKITPQLKRENRRVVGLHFDIEYKTNIEKNNQNIADEDIETAFSESKIELSATLIKFLETKTPQQVAVCIQAANGYIDSLLNRGQDANIGSVYFKAIQDDWGKPLVDAEEQEKRKRQEQAEEKKKKEDLRKEAELTAQQQADRIRKTIDFVLTLDDGQKAELFNAVQEKTYMKKSFDNKLAESMEAVVGAGPFHAEFRTQISRLFNFNFD